MLYLWADSSAADPFTRVFSERRQRSNSFRDWQGWLVIGLSLLGFGVGAEDILKQLLAQGFGVSGSGLRLLTSHRIEAWKGLEVGFAC